MEVTIMDEDKEMIKEFLQKECLGKANAKKYKELNELLPLNNRTIRVIINNLRKEGMPICSGSNGVWWSNSKKELKQTINSLESRITDLSDVIKGLKRVYKTI